MFLIEIDTDNAAFEGDNLGPELARILEKLAAKYRDEGASYPRIDGLRDTNGNQVGQAWFQVVRNGADD